MSVLRVLLDTNVILDLVLRREPWLSQAQAMWDVRDAKQITCYVPASSLTDVFYISRKQIGNDQAKHALRYCLANFEIVTVSRLLIEHALTLAGNDVEDNVLISCALAEALDLIVTRDVGDFSHSPIKAIEPSDVVRHLSLP